MNSEYLSKDILEEDFLKTFAPYHYVQIMLGSCRVDARNRFVTAPSVWQKLHTVLNVLLILTCYCFILFHLQETYYITSPNLYRWLIFFAFAQLIIVFSNLVHVRFINDKANVQFFIKLQEIERLLKIDKDTTLNSIQYMFNLTATLFIVFAAVAVFITALTCDRELTLVALGFTFSEMPLMIEMSLCSNLIFYFAMRIRFVNAILVNCLKGDIELEEPIKAYPLPTNYTYLRHLAAKTLKFESSETDIYLREIISGFDMFNLLYRFQILLFCAKLFMFTLLAFQYIAVSLRSSAFDVVLTGMIGSLISFDFFMALFLGIRYEIFFKSIQKTKHLAISIMSINLNGPLRDKAKKMYNIMEDIPPFFSVYGMWNMEGRVLLALLNVITSFVVTLLQFAVL